MFFFSIVQQFLAIITILSASEGSEFILQIIAIVFTVVCEAI